MYKIYIKVNNIAMLLPINPEEINFVYQTTINRYEIIGLGEIAEFSSDKLVETRISSFIPKQNTNLITHSDILAKRFVEELLDAKSEGQVIELIIKRNTLDNINLNCYIGEFNVIEKAGEVGDVYYNLSLLQWKSHAPQIVEIQQPAPIQIVIPVNTTGSQYVAQVTGLTNTQNTTETKTTPSGKVEKKETQIKGEVTIPKTTNEIVKGDSVIINGTGYNTPDGIDYDLMSLNPSKQFNNTKGVIGSVCKTHKYPYQVVMESIPFYFAKDSLKKVSSQGSILGGGGSSGGGNGGETR